MTRQNKKRGYDYSLLAVVFLLVIIGLIILYSTSAYNGQVKFHDRFYYLKKQAFATALGLALMFFYGEYRLSYLAEICSAGIYYGVTVVCSGFDCGG